MTLQFPDNQHIVDNLTSLYGTEQNVLDKLDLWPGGMLETTPRGPGQLFRTIIKNQLTRVRDGDRFWFENYKMNKYKPF